MKLAVITCLAMLVAVSYATENQDAIDLIRRLLESKGGAKKTPAFHDVDVVKSSELMSKMRNLKASKVRSLAHKHVDSLCENAYVELEDTNGDVEEGILLYPKELASLLPTQPPAHKFSDRFGGCTFHIHTDGDHMIFIYVNMWFTGEVAPACGADGLGQLTFYGGDSAESPELGRACGQFEHAFVPHTREVFISFTPDEGNKVQYFVYYEIVTKENVLESTDHGEDPVGHADPHAAPAANPAAPAADPAAPVARRGRFHNNY